MKTAFWKADWFFGLVVVIALFGFARMSGFIPGLERWAYDQGVRMTSKSPSDKIAVIAIDEQSIANIGRWPWPREVQAKMIDQLAASKAKVIGNTSFFFEPQKDPGLAYVEKMLDIYNKAYPPTPGEVVPGVAPIGGQTPAATPNYPAGEVGEIGKLLNEASVTLNSDVLLAASMKKANNVLVPLVFEQLSFRPADGKPDKPLPEYISKNTIGGFSGSSGQFLYGINALIPIEGIGGAAAGVGHLNSSLDEDGGVRFEPLVIDYYGQQYPSLSLMLAAKSLNLTSKDIKVKLGESVSVGNKTIRTDDLGQ
ncbi:MAG TPA: CHASE2 domain-containing protein, partial [Usitatibacter sp.]|nr:CHASE2 domain-containing protein [Usitatibacter sp.]